VKRLVKRTSVLAVIVLGGSFYGQDLVSLVAGPGSQHELLRRAWSSKTSNLLVEAEGRVVRVRPNFVDLVAVQEFEAEFPNGHVVLIRHNLNETPRVPVWNSSQVRVRGEYDWSVNGGVIHWTHDDPTGQREGGWIEFQGERYF